MPPRPSTADKLIRFPEFHGVEELKPGPIVDMGAQRVAEEIQIGNHMNRRRAHNEIVHPLVAPFFGVTLATKNNTDVVTVYDGGLAMVRAYGGLALPR